MNVDRVRNKTGNRVNLIVPIIVLISIDKTPFANAHATKWRMWIKDSLSVIPRAIKRRDQPSSRLWPADCEWLWTTLQTHRQHLRVIIINHLCLAATRGRPPRKSRCVKSALISLSDSSSGTNIGIMQRNNVHVLYARYWQLHCDYY